MFERRTQAYDQADRAANDQNPLNNSPQRMFLSSMNDDITSANAFRGALGLRRSSSRSHGAGELGLLIDGGCGANGESLVDAVGMKGARGEVSVACGIGASEGVVFSATGIAVGGE